MDFGTTQIKDTVRRILQNVSPSRENMALIAMLNDLLSAEVIEPVDYSYNVAFYTPGAASAIAAGATVNGSVNIQADAPFMLLNQTYIANTDNAAQTAATRIIPNAVVTINDTGSGAQMMDQQTPITSIFGTGELPFVLPEPKIFTSNATLQVKVTNIDAAQNINLFLTFNGVKLYRKN